MATPRLTAAARAELIRRGCRHCRKPLGDDVVFGSEPMAWYDPTPVAYAAHRECEDDNRNLRKEVERQSRARGGRE